MGSASPVLPQQPYSVLTTRTGTHGQAYWESGQRRNERVAGTNGGNGGRRCLLELFVNVPQVIEAPERQHVVVFTFDG